jgi:SAM-dependent methyltransferase
MLGGTVTADRPCAVCGRVSSELVYEIDDFPVVRCRCCGLVFVGRSQSPESLVALYDRSYWEDSQEVGYDGYGAAEKRKRHHFSTLLDQLELFASPGAMLEIGSAYGYFLDEARSRGWQVRGIEPSAHAAGYARERFGLDVSPGPAEALRIDRDSLDAVVLWDVIEHLPDPRRTLSWAHRALRSGGAIALSTGDVDSLSARLHGADWSLMTPPWHQFYFSRATMRRLLKDVGFSVERVGGDGVVAVDPTSESPRVPTGLALMLRSKAVTTLARRFGAGMTMFIFARKLPTT